MLLNFFCFGHFYFGHLNLFRISIFMLHNFEFIILIPQSWCDATLGLSCLKAPPGRRRQK